MRSESIEYGRPSAMPNRSLDADKDRHFAERRAGERTPRGAMPLRADQRRRYA